MRRTTWRTLVSCPGAVGRPAFRKYLLTTMSVASCDHSAGTSTSFISNTTEPSGFVITVRRLSQRTSSSGSTPTFVKRRGTRTPLPDGSEEEEWLRGTCVSNVCVIPDLQASSSAATEHWGLASYSSSLSVFLDS